MKKDNNELVQLVCIDIKYNQYELVRYCTKLNFMIKNGFKTLLSYTNYNNLITPILNISDGMLGDSLQLKFICTFNTDINNVDEALLRKGRLSLKYEFKKLSKERVQKLFDKLNIEAIATEDMSLCDVYNYETETGQKEKKKIGF